MIKKMLMIGIFVLLSLQVVPAASIDEKITDELNKNGEARVIVKLKEDSLIDSGKLKQRFSAKAEMISKKQEKVLSDLESRRLLKGKALAENKEFFELKHKYTTVSGFSGKITRDALEELKNNPDVESIQIDSPVSALLDASAPLINANDVWGLSLSGTNLTGRGEAVCVLDTGIDYTHSAFGGCSIARYSSTGTNESYVLQSAHNYANNLDYTWNITKPGYNRIAVHFVNISLEYQGEVSGYDTLDRIIVYDYNMREIANYHGINGVITDLWTPYSEGDTVYIRMVTDGSQTDYGFYIDQVRNGTTNTTYNWSSCSKVIGGWDFVNNDGDPLDDNSHGTHAAGIISSNDSTYRGAAYDAKIVAGKVLDSAGNGWTSDVIAGIDFCVNNSERFNISVISMSLGGNAYYSSYCNNDAAADSINSAVAKNILVAVASGNNGNTVNISSPACVQNATAVSSTTKSDTVSSFSNRNSLIDLMAPGGTSGGSGACPNANYICSTQRGGGFIGYSGTSMATPHVAAAAVLLQQFSKLQNGTALTPLQIENALKNTGVLIDDSGGSGLTYKRIDAYAAIQSLDSNAPAINFTAPTLENNSALPKGEMNSSFVVNVTVSDSVNNISACLLEFNGANETMTKTGTGSSVSCYINKTTNETGTFVYKVYANDTRNNIAVVYRQIRIKVNQLPNVTSASISSTDSLNRSNGTLTGSFGYADTDGDTITLNETMWYNNSVEVVSLRNLTQVSRGNLTKNQVWTFSARVYDGANWSTWLNSSNFTIKNAAPAITQILNITLNETSLVNITVNATDLDNDAMSYSINDTRFSQSTNSFTWLTNLSDSGVYTVRVVINDSESNSTQDVAVTVYNLPDFDNDGNPDYNDTDDDNDGMNDTLDSLTGNLTSINSTTTVRLFVNGSDNLSQIFNSTLAVNVTDPSNNSLITFDWNFTKATMVLNWTIEYDSGAGTMRIKGIDLTGQGAKKTVYMNKANSGYNRVCIKDDETTAVSSIPSDCSGYTALICDGSANGQYRCTDLGSSFKVEGLNHSALKEYQYTAPSSSSGGGGGGGGSTKKTTTTTTTAVKTNCTENWLCLAWDTCKEGFQIRDCIDQNKCGTELLKPSVTKFCTEQTEQQIQTQTEQQAATQNIINTDSRDMNNTTTGMLATPPEPEQTRQIGEKSLFGIDITIPLILLSLLVIIAFYIKKEVL